MPRILPSSRREASVLALLRAVLGLAALAALYGAPWLSLAPNRLAPGQPVGAEAALGSVLHAIALALAAALALGSTGLRRWRWAALALTLAALLALLVLTGRAAAGLLAGQAPSARVMLGTGFWLASSLLLVIAVETARETGRRFVPAAALALPVLAVAAGWRVGLFDALSLAVEARNRADLLGAALVRHVLLAGAALTLALAAAIPLGWLAFRSRRAEAAVGAALSAVQVIPALALFGLLVPLLALVLQAAPALRALGLAAIGPVPALIGIAAYLALPLVRGLVAGLQAADPAVVEAARAMGFTEGRLAREVRIPLGLPVLAGALRVAAVQSVGLATLGGLIGAGGLGALVFEGMAQFAPDLILLSAAPVVVLAVGIDAALGALAGRHRNPR